MPTRLTIPVYDGVFFITFTCTDWLSLFEMANSYDSVYKWFDYLKGKGHYIIGYIVMHNHLHCLIAFRNTKGESINKIIGNGKRFLAYDIVRRLQEQGRSDVLLLLASKVSTADRKKQKVHEVFIPSFDWKECWTEKFFIQKLDYMHSNPIKGKWKLVKQYWDYTHSSAQYYVTGKQGYYPVTHFGELRNIDLTIPTPE